MRCRAHAHALASDEPTAKRVTLAVHDLAVQDSFTELGCTGLGWTGLGCAAKRVTLAVQDSFTLHRTREAWWGTDPDGGTDARWCVRPDVGTAPAPAARRHNPAAHYSMRRSISAQLQDQQHGSFSRTCTFRTLRVGIRVVVPNVSAKKY